MALFSIFLLSNIDSSLLFNYRFPTLVLSEFAMLSMISCVHVIAGCKAP